MVTPLARRRVSVVARQSVTLDRLCDGRLRLGVGLGAPDDEFTRFGESADPKRRAQLLDESLEALQLLWSGAAVSYRGDLVTLDDVEFRPTPVNGRIPIWVAGGWPGGAPFRRAARFDGVWPVAKVGGYLQRRRVRRVRRRGPAPPRHRRSVRCVLRRPQPGAGDADDHRQDRPTRRGRDDVVDRLARRSDGPVRTTPRSRPGRTSELTCATGTFASRF